MSPRWSGHVVVWSVCPCWYSIYPCGLSCGVVCNAEGALWASYYASTINSRARVDALMSHRDGREHSICGYGPIGHSSGNAYCRVLSTLCALGAASQACGVKVHDVTRPTFLDGIVMFGTSTAYRALRHRESGVVSIPQVVEKVQHFAPPYVAAPG